MWYFARVVSCVGEPLDGVLKAVLEVCEVQILRLSIFTYIIHTWFSQSGVDDPDNDVEIVLLSRVGLLL